MAVACMFEHEYTKGEMIIKQGDVGDRLYVVESGLYEVKKGGKRESICQAGDCFGEVSLISSSHLRTAEVVCKQSGKVWVMDRATYESLTERGGELKVESESWAVPTRSNQPSPFAPRPPP